MCTLQVFNQDNTNPDAKKDASGCWKRGYVVAVYDDGECKEPPAPKSKTIFIHLPGVDKAKMLDYIAAETETIPDLKTGEDQEEIKRRRLYKLDIDELKTELTKDKSNGAKYIKELDEKKSLTVAKGNADKFVITKIKNQKTAQFEKAKITKQIAKAKA